MNWKVATAALAVAAMAAAPLASAKPGNGNGNGNGNGTRQTATAPAPSPAKPGTAPQGKGAGKPSTPPGQIVSGIARSGAGAAGILGALSQLKPDVKGLQNALTRVSTEVVGRGTSSSRSRARAMTARMTKPAIPAPTRTAIIDPRLELSGPSCRGL